MQLRRQQKTFARNRFAMDPSRPIGRSSATVTDISAEAADRIQVTFSTPVIPASLPTTFYAGAEGDETVTAMQRISETVLELTFTGEVAGTDLIVEGGDIGIRTPVGGFVPAGTYAIPTFP